MRRGSHLVRDLAACPDCKKLALKSKAFAFEGEHVHPECFLARYDRRRVYWFLARLPASELGKLTIGQSRQFGLDGRKVMEIYQRKVDER